MSNTLLRAGVIGFPVSHSLSPKLHNYWLKLHHINGLYRAHEVAPEALGDFVKTMAEEGFSGCNVTLPHKEKILTLMDRLDPLAEEVGAVNTVVIEQGQLIGYNTDVAGFSDNVRPYLHGTRKAVILGAGGAARAVAVALGLLGFKDIVVSNRTRENADMLAVEYDLQAVDWKQKEAALRGADLLVNTTLLGLAGQPNLALSLEMLPLHALVTDIVYSPLKTSLLMQANALGFHTIDGLGMLLYQAAPGFEKWFGVKPVVDETLRNYILGT